MDVFEIVTEIKPLLDNFIQLDNKEIEHLRVLSNNLSVECADALYDMEIMERVGYRVGYDD